MEQGGPLIQHIRHPYKKKRNLDTDIYTEKYHVECQIIPLQAKRSSPRLLKKKPQKKICQKPGEA